MKKTIIGIGLATLCAGCNLETSTSIKVQMPNGAIVTYSSPKDVTLEGLNVSVNPTNGVVTASVKKWGSSNNPQVLNSAGQQDVAVINAASAAVNSGVQAGMAAAATGGTSLATKAVK